MEDDKRYKFIICQATNAPANLKKEFGEARYRVFNKDDPYANLNHEDKTEFDAYDERDTTLYIFAVVEVGGDQSLLVGVRALPTLFGYELENKSWSYMTDEIFDGHELPKSPTIFESMRWVGVSMKRNDRKIGDGLAMMGLHQAGKDYGFTEIFGVTTTRAQKFMDREGYTNYSITPLIDTGRDGDTLEINYQVLDEAFLRIATKKYKDALAKELAEA